VSDLVHVAAQREANQDVGEAVNAGERVAPRIEKSKATISTVYR